MTALKRLFLPAVFSLLLVPFSAHASVRINEMAWMGSETSSRDEWIELKNTADVEVDVSGWVIENARSGGNSLTFPEGTAVPANSFFLLTNRDPNDPDDDTVLTVLVDWVAGNINLANNYENNGSLVLKDEEGSEIDRTPAPSGSSWPAGDNSTKETMQFTESGEWITAPATPGASNATEDTSSINDDDTDTSSDPSDNDNEEEADTENDSDAASDNAHDASVHDSPQEVSEFPDLPEKLLVTAGRDRAGIAGAPLSFSARSVDESNDPVDARFKWSFGDGASAAGKDVRHTYRHPGEYVVVLNASHGDLSAVALAAVVVREPEIVMTAATVGPDGHITLRNNGPDVNIGAWMLDVHGRRFTFPRDTILAEGAAISFSRTITGLSAREGDIVTLRFPSGTIVPQPDGSPVSLIAGEEPEESGDEGAEDNTEGDDTVENDEDAQPEQGESDPVSKNQADGTASQTISEMSHTLEQAIEQIVVMERRLAVLAASGTNNASSHSDANSPTLLPPAREEEAGPLAEADADIPFQSESEEEERKEGREKTENTNLAAAAEAVTVVEKPTSWWRKLVGFFF